MRCDRSPRIAFAAPVTLLVDDAALQGQARDLSANGMFVEQVTPAPQLDSRVALFFDLPGGQRVNGQARVVRAVDQHDSRARERPGVALRFEALEGPGARRVAGFVADCTSARREIDAPVRLRLGDEQGVVIRASAQRAFDRVLSLQCPLPFLRLGSAVQLLSPRADSVEPGHSGMLRWVSIHVPPDSDTPRINLGVQLDSQPAAAGAVLEQAISAAPVRGPLGAWEVNVSDELAFGDASPSSIQHDPTIDDSPRAREPAPARRRHLGLGVAFLALVLAVAALLLVALTELGDSPEALSRPEARALVAPAPDPARTSTAAQPATAALRREAVPPAARDVDLSAQPSTTATAESEATPTRVEARPRQRHPARRATRDRPRAQAVSGYLRDARQALRARRFDHAHRLATRAMRLDPGNQQALEIMSRALQGKLR